MFAQKKSWGRWPGIAAECTTEHLESKKRETAERRGILMPAHCPHSPSALLGPTMVARGTCTYLSIHTVHVMQCSVLRSLCGILFINL